MARVRSSLGALGWTVLILAMAGCALIPLAVWALDAILVLDGIEGEDNSHSGFENAITVDAFSIDVTNGSDLQSGGTGTTSSGGDLVVVKPIDKSTPILMRRAADLNVIPSGRLHVFRDEGGKAVNYYTIAIDPVVVKSVRQGGGVTEERESVSLNYAKIKWTYTAQDGTVVGDGWDFQNNVSN